MIEATNIRGPKRYPVTSDEHSECASAPLAGLDFAYWWTDGDDGGLYLKVPHRDREEGTVHRVRCRHSDRPRLSYEDGELCWLVDERHARPEEASGVELDVRMLDGSVWAIPAHIVADHRARRRAESHGRDYQEVYDETLRNDFELAGWAVEELEWEEVRPYARRVSRAAEEADYAEGWKRGEMRILRPAE